MGALLSSVAGRSPSRFPRWLRLARFGRVCTSRAAWTACPGGPIKSLLGNSNRARAMDGPGFQFGWLNDPRLAAHALSPSAVWLWGTQPVRILWANPVGANVFDAPSPAAAARLAVQANDAAAQQMARLATTLPAGGSPRLERLRGFG